MIYLFGEYELDTACYELRRAGKRLQIEPKAFDLLAYLVQQRGRVVSKDALFEHLWPQQFVSDSALVYCIMMARKAVGDSGRAQRLIATVHGRGYRFIGTVEERSPEVPPAPTAPSLATSVQYETPSAPTAQSRPATERRQISVLYGTIVATSRPASADAAEDLDGILQDAREVCAETMQRFDGYVVPYTGPGLLVYFGYPQAHEDDAYRAVRSGVEIVRALGTLATSLMPEAPVRLAAQVGIHTGSMAISAKEAEQRQPLSALADVPRMAVQLHDLAEANAVVLSQATWKLVEGYFTCQPLGTFVLEERSQPLTVYQVHQETTAQNRFEVALLKGLSPLVGRQQETGILLERWAQVQAGQGQVIFLSGEAGIGKSRLVQVLTEHLTDTPHVRLDSRGSPYYQQSALQPLIESLQRRIQWRQDETPPEKLRRLETALQPYGLPLAETVPPLAALLDVPLAGQYAPLPLTPQRQKQQTFEVLVAWLLRQAERQPLCFVLEDLHWVDASTLELLGLLLEQVATARILTLCTFRPDFRLPWALRSNYTYLTLGRLSEQQTAMLMQHVAGDKPLPPEVVQQIAAKTDGIPLFIEELTKMVLESGLIKECHGRYELVGTLPPLAIPTTLRDSLMARLDRLGAAKFVAQLGALLGREFPEALLQAVTLLDADSLQQALRQLLDAELLQQRGLPPQARYSFKHALIQEAAKASLLRHTRRLYHKQIAQVLERQYAGTPEAHPELIAQHYTQAGLLREAVGYWQQAGQRALAQSAHVEAAGHLRQGLEALAVLPESPERQQQELRFLLALGLAMIATRGYAAPEVGQVYNRAHALYQMGEQTPQHFPVLVGLWNYYLVRAELQTAYGLGQQCWHLAQQSHDTTLGLEAQAMLGVTQFFLGEFLQARAHLEQSIAMQDLVPSPAASLHTAGLPVVACSAYLAFILWFLGYPAQAQSQSQKALSLARHVGHPYSLAYALTILGWVQQFLTGGENGQEFAETTQTIAAEHGFPFWEAQSRILFGRALCQHGQVDTGLATMRQGLQVYQATGAALLRPFFLAYLAEIYAQTGETTAGLEVVSDALTLTENTGERWCVAELYRLRGVLLLAQQDTPSQWLAAEESLRQALEIARQQHSAALELRVAMDLSRLWRQQGKPAAARQVLADVYERFAEGLDTADLQAAATLLHELA